MGFTSLQRDIHSLELKLDSLNRTKSIEQYADTLDREYISKLDSEIADVQNKLNSIDPVRILKLKQETDKRNLELKQIENDRLATLKDNAELEKKMQNAFNVVILFPPRLEFKDDYENKIIKLVQNKAPFVKFSLVCSRKQDYHGFFHFEDLYYKHRDVLVATNNIGTNIFKAKRVVSEYKGWWATISKLLGDVNPDAVVVIADPNSELDKPFLQFLDNVIKKYRISLVKHITL